MKTIRLLSLIFTVCLGYGSMMAQNAPQASRPAKQEKANKVEMTPEQRIDAQVARMGKSLMLDDAKLAQFSSLYKEYLTALKDCYPAPEPPAAEKEKKAEPTETQVLQDIEKRFEIQEKVLDTQKKYYASLKKILNARQLEKVFSMPRPDKMNKRNFPMRPGRMVQPGKMPAPCCPNDCPAEPQAPQMPQE